MRAGVVRPRGDGHDERRVGRGRLCGGGVRKGWEKGGGEEKGKTNLDDAAAGAGGVEEVVREPEEPRAPVHHGHLEFRACRAARPLRVHSVYACHAGVDG